MAAAASRAAGLLPQRGSGARPTGDDDGVQTAHIDAQLEGVGGGHAEDVAAVKGALARGDVGAVLVEPILGRGGCVVPPPGFLAALRAACIVSPAGWNSAT